MVALDDTTVREQVARVDALLEALENVADPVARQTATEVVEALLDLYGEGLARLVERVADHDDGEIARALATDELVSHLLLLHGLHPVPLAVRVREALDEVRPYLDSHGGDVELLGVEDGVARLRLDGSCSGCPSSAVTLKLAIEAAIQKAAPDLERVEAEGAAAPEPSPGLVSLPMAQTAQAPPQPEPAWTTAAIPELAENQPLVRDVAGEAVLFVRRKGSVYAYRPGCPGCGRSLGDGVVHGGELVCCDCGHRYDVRRAGRGVDAPDLHLEPVPLLVDRPGAVKVALGSVA
jgi:Fe-S cluster biogenesis protein NfuA/nitrite reductase/ring-hydroxylating ferredoxin subunit